VELISEFACVWQIDFGDAKFFDETVYDYSFEYGETANDPDQVQSDGEW